MSETIEQALFKVESVHHIHDIQCLCGFKSHVSRDRTKHIMEVTLEAAGHDKLTSAIAEVQKHIEDCNRNGYRVDGDYLTWAIDKALKGDA